MTESVAAGPSASQSNKSARLAHALPQSYKVDTEALRERLAKAQSLGEVVSLSSQDSLALSAFKSGLGVESATVPSEITNSYRAFFQGEARPSDPEGSSLTVNGASFSPQEFASASSVLRAAADALSAGTGRNTSLDYANYAEFATAEAAVGSWAAKKLNDSQALAVCDAFSQYTASLVQRQELLVASGSFTGSLDTQNEYYGIKHVLSHDEEQMLSAFRARFAGKGQLSFASTTAATGTAALTQIATNQALIGEVKDAFSGLDLQDDKSLDRSLERYRQLMQPAYAAYGVTKSQSNLISKLKDNLQGIIAAVDKAARGGLSEKA